MEVLELFTKPELRALKWRDESAVSIKSATGH